MRSIVLYCPHLDRDIRGILSKVPDPSILTGYPTPHGHDGCLEMHHAAVRIARDNRWPMVFVMEDDCQFTKHFLYERWCADAEWADAHGYGAMAGGCVKVYDPKVVREGMVACSSFHSAHCMVYFARAYGAILQTVQPFDLSIGHQGIKCVMTYPIVAVQRPTFSGILQREVNYVPLYEQYEGHLGRELGIRP